MKYQTPYTEAFSYTRYSTKGQNKQHGGSSEYRQDANFVRVCNDYGLKAIDYKVLLDGVSAFGKDKEGNRKNFPYLLKIVDDIKSGVIRQNVVMIVERTDRFGRGDMDEAYDMLRKIVLAGCPVWIEGILLDKPALNNDELTGTVRRRMVQANEYSSNLSNAVLTALKNRVEMILNGERFMVNQEGEKVRILLNHLPSWVDKEKWVVNSKGDTIKKIFGMYLSGIGPAAIAHKFNEENIPTLAEKGRIKEKAQWGQGVIYRLLSNNQLIGEYVVTVTDPETKITTTHTISDYLPPVVDKKTFDLVAAKLDDNAGKRPAVTGEKRIINLFHGIGFCSICGEKIRVRPCKGVARMDCQGRVKGGSGCNHQTIKYEPLEKSLHTFLMFNVNDMISDEQGNTANAHVQILRGQLAEVEKVSENAKRQLNKAIENGWDDAISGISDKLKLCKKQTAELSKKIEIESARVVALNGSDDKYKQLVLSIKEGLTDTETRIKVQSWLRENVNRVDVDRINKTFSMDFRNGGFIKIDFEQNKPVEIRKPSSVSFQAAKGLSKENLTVYGK